MRRYRHLALPITLAALLAACAPAVGEPTTSPRATPNDMPSMTESAAPSTTPADSTLSPNPSTHDADGMDHADGSGSTVVEVDIANFAFEPVELTIIAGTEVVFTNSDSAPHTVTAGTEDEPMPEVFDSGLLQTGDEFRFVFDEPGEYAYFCKRHPPMTGTIVVEP